jgi:amidohydrolase
MHLFEELQELRRTIHSDPEVAHTEERTAARIVEFIERARPDRIVTGIGGHGVVAEFVGEAEGPTLLFRAELDALPIKERGDIPHKSKTDGVAHVCGHDGHMTTLAGLARRLGERRPKRGRVVCLFQPAEEVGEGAALVVADPKFEPFRFDYGFALHNLPGYPFGEVVVKDGPFAAASKGLIVELTGETSHASEPEKGVSPALAMAELVAAIAKSPSEPGYRDFALATVIHARLGEVAFGTSPGEATVMATLRAYLDEDVATLNDRAIEAATRLAERDGLRTATRHTEEFPATVNAPEAADLVRRAARKANRGIVEVETPFRWSEDFGVFGAIGATAFFGVGSGERQPALHNGTFDYPDDLLPVGVELFVNIIKDTLGEA